MTGLDDLAWRRSREGQAQIRLRRAIDAVRDALTQAPSRGVTMLRITEMTGLSRATVVRIVDLLVESGSARIAADPLDSSVRRIHPANGGDRP